jgi:hypothetical protein
MLLEKNLTFIALILIVCIFWFFRDINSMLIFNIYNISDLSRYYAEFIHIRSVFNFPSFHEDFGYYWVVLTLNFFGINFHFFLFCILFFSYLSFLLIFYRLTGFKKWYIYLILFLGLSFWLQSLVTTTFRQGIAFLILISFLFKKETMLFLPKLLTIILAASFHFSAIFLIPYIFFDKYFAKRLIILDIIFIFVFFLYVLGYTSILSNLFINISTYLSIDIRSLAAQGTYITGFSIYKAFAILIPALSFRLSNLSNFNSNMLGRRIYVFYIFVCICGMILSDLPYHDRILLYGWGISPILICCFIITLFVWLTNTFNKNYLYN